MTSNIIFRELTDFNEYHHLENIQFDSWDVPEREMVPKRIPYATFKSGGVVIGAFLDDMMIGYVWGWVGRDDQGKNYIYSHHNAVKKEYQNEGIGLQLKSEQRKWAINKGFELIQWVFDPLQTKNCYLNLHKLGVICNTYKVNYWLELKDTLNEGIETDRFFCNWVLKSDHVEAHLNKKFEDYNTIINTPSNQILKTCITGDFLEIKDVNLDMDDSILALEVPSNYIEMKKTNKQLAIGWRMKTRTVFQNYFGKDYTVVDFILDKQQERIRCYHILKR